MKKTMSFFCRITLMILAFVTGASSGVMMAEASNLPDAGKQQPVRTVRVEQTVFPLKQEGVKPATQISI